MSAQADAGTWQIGEWIADPADDTLSRGAESPTGNPKLHFQRTYFQRTYLLTLMSHLMQNNYQETEHQEIV